MSSQMVARYFNRVLGVQSVPFASSALIGGAAKVIVLLDVRDADSSASLEQMGARLLEAIRSEWLKKSADELPKFEWIRVGQVDWRDAVLDQGSQAKLVIVCGAGDVHQTPKNVLHVPSLIEMQSSPVVKRDAWRAMQKSLAETN